MSSLAASARWALRVLEHPLAVGLVLLALAVPAASMLLAPVANGDIAWHLALGRWIAEQAAIPLHEPFTYTARGAPMVAHEWLAQWLYWQCTALAGLDGLRAAHVGLAAATLGLAFASFRIAGAPPALGLLATAVFGALVEPRFQVRPHMLNPLFGIALGTLLFQPRYAAAVQVPAVIAALALAVALWANLHSAAVMLPALLWAWLAVDWLQRRPGGRPPWPHDPGGGRPRRAVALAVACSLALLATPNHVKLFPYLIESARVNSGRSTEWLSLLRFAGDGEHAGLIAAWAVVVAATIIAAVHVLRERRSLATGAIALACALAPLQSVRFTWLAFLPLGFVAGETARWLARCTPERRNIVLAASGLAAVGLALAGAPGARPQAGLPFFHPNHFPIHSVGLLREVPIEGRIFARAEWGGFITLMLDARVPIFADGRWVTIGDRVVRDGHIIATGRPRALHLLDQWEIEAVIVERRWLDTDRDRARRNEGWIRAFAGYNSAIWLRRGERGRANRSAFAAYYARLGIPFDPERGFLPAAAERANPAWASLHGVRDRYVRHFLPGGRRSEAGFEASRSQDQARDR
jgi:hypothetical protein